MADRPILFSAPMIRALLAGMKTQTRRLFKNIEQLPSGNFHIYANGGGVVGVREEDVPAQAPDYARIQIGDRLWVRETWAPLSALTHNDPGAQALADGGFYRADGGTVDGEISKWLPSIFMPRHASRLVLVVTDVRVERLQNISEEDAIVEGIQRNTGGNGDQWMDYPEGSSAAGWLDPRRSYASLWNSINGAGAWDTNPWVVAYSFEVHRGNIDQIEQVAA